MVPRIKESRGNPVPPPCVTSGRRKHTAVLISQKLVAKCHKEIRIFGADRRVGPSFRRDRAVSRRVARPAHKSGQPEGILPIPSVLSVSCG